MILKLPHQTIILVVKGFREMFIQRFKGFYAFGPLFCRSTLHSSEWVLLDPYIQHVDLDYFENLEGEENFFFFFFFYSSLNDAFGESGHIQIKGDGRVTCLFSFP